MCMESTVPVVCRVEMTLNAVFIVFALFWASTVAPSPNQSKQYRSDYEYNKKTDAFYKLHIESCGGFQAKYVCETEGAQLMVPATKADIVQLHSMFKRYPDLGDYVWVGDDGQTHESAEEEPIINMDPSSEQGSWETAGQCDVVTRQGEIATRPCHLRQPFICKVEAIKAPYDPNCDVYSTGYEYYSDSGSCYKVPRVIFSWDQAYKECQAEGAHLVVINSVTEHTTVWHIMNITTPVHGAKASWFFFAGFRAERPTNGEPRVFKTVFNQTLEEAGYAVWSTNEPNNYLDSEYCGSLFRNDGDLNDVECAHEYAFICEKEKHM